MTIYPPVAGLANPAPQLAPATAEELADLLRAASEQGQVLVPWGAGTLQHLGAPPPAEAQRLATSGLDRVLEYNPADLTIAVEAGVTLAAVQAALREHGQWLPWDPPAPAHATIGGLLAAGSSGPLRLGYGTPRDWVLGMRVALGDGRLVKSGGKVVKNVAGYDTHKLHLGALGTLGVIAAVTLKVAPLPERMRSLVFACASYADACALAGRLRERPLAPASLVVAAGGAAGLPDARVVLAARFAGIAAAVERQAVAAIVAARAHGAASLDLDAAGHSRIWQDLVGFADPNHACGTQSGEQIIIRAGAPVATLPDVLNGLANHAPEGGRLLIGEAGVGMAHARWGIHAAEPGRIAGALASLRAALAALGGYAVAEAVPQQLELDRWGAPPPTLALMRGLKAQWDPRGILNRGRYVGGI